MGVNRIYSRKMKLNKLISVFSACFLAALAQDTNFCNDDWDLYTLSTETGDHHLCFLFGQEREQVPYGPVLNSWITEKLLEKISRSGTPEERRPQYGTQYWLGARDFGFHNEHVPGTWMWETRNTTVNWFDWGDGEPNNFNGQNCLTYLLYTDLFGVSRFHWNDWDCEAAADYICEKRID